MVLGPVCPLLVSLDHDHTFVNRLFINLSLITKFECAYLSCQGPDCYRGIVCRDLCLLMIQRTWDAVLSFPGSWEVGRGREIREKIKRSLPKNLQIGLLRRDPARKSSEL